MLSGNCVAGRGDMFKVSEGAAGGGERSKFGSDGNSFLMNISLALAC